MDNNKSDINKTNFSDLFSKSDVVKLLEGYQKIKHRDLDRLRKGIQIKYFVKENGKHAYRTGGYLKYVYDDYIILQNAGSSWSVQKKDTIFFIKVDVDVELLKRRVERTNKLVNELGGRKIEVLSDSEEIDNFTKDIFSKLSKPKKPTQRSVERIKKKFKIKKWQYLTPPYLSTIDVIRYITLDGETISQLAMITSIKLYKETKTIKHIEVSNMDDKKEYRWKINPYKYLFFKHPKSAELAVSKAIARKLVVTLGLMVLYSTPQKEIKEEFNKESNGQLPRQIFMFWDKGWDKAPYICKECYYSWKHYNPDWNIILVSDENLSEYVPQSVIDKVNKIEKPQHRADLIRINILNQCGGVWVDSSIFCNKPLDMWLYKYMKCGVFYFKYDKSSGLQNYRIGNWFIASTMGNYITETFCKAYNEHWKDKIVDQYFGFHFLFDRLCNKDKKFSKMYDEIPFFDGRKPRITTKHFQGVDVNLTKPITDPVKIILNNKDVPMFKFSTKDASPNGNVEKGSTMEYLLNTIKQIKTD